MNRLLTVTLCGCITLMGCQSVQNASSESSQVSTPVADTAHNSRNSLDWFGTYKGMVPCSDCDGTNIFLDLKKDSSYMMSRSHIGKMSITVMEEGKAVWNESGSGILVDDMIFRVQENRLLLIDDANEPIRNQDGESYLLLKQTNQ
ncbi:copper resistance protein NlpE [Vibrio sp. HN007]|uniref:copper resistance protein NlpE n=1 Tax=Vibrio iocasae TaxID=3098914 RepID=UPI0035D42EFA